MDWFKQRALAALGFEDWVVTPEWTYSKETLLNHCDLLQIYNRSLLVLHASPLTPSYHGNDISRTCQIMGNVNEAASESAHSGGANTKELPGALQTGPEDYTTNSEALTNSDNVNNGIPPSPSLSTEDERDPVDISQPSSPHDADPSATRIATASSSDIQSPPNAVFDLSTQSSNTSFPISESALPTTFDVSAEISFLNTRELSDYFVTPSLTHVDVAEHVPLSEMSSVTSVAAETGQTLSFSHGSDCLLLASDALILSRDGDDATKLLSTTTARDPGGTDGSVLNFSVPALGLNPATLVTSTIGAIASIDSHRNVLLIQPSVRIPETTGSVTPIPVVSAHASHQQPRETLVPIDNVVSVIGDAISTTKSTPPKSELYMDKEAILANIPLASTYADAANLAAQHPELAKELLNRPLLASSQAAAPAVPEISYAAPPRATQSARPGDHRRPLRRGGKKCRTQSRSLSGTAQDSQDCSKSRYVQDEDTRSRNEIQTDKRSGRLDALPHLDRPQNSSQNQRNIGDSSGTGRQAAHQSDHRDADASRGPLDRKPSHDIDQLISDTQGQLIQDQPVSQVPSHETRTAKTFDYSDADEWTHTHGPWSPVNQQHSGSHINIQVVRQAVSDTEWGPAHDPWLSETVSTKSGGLPGSHFRVSQNVTPNTYASDAGDNLWQAPHDPWIAEQPIITSDITSRKYHHKQAPSVVQDGYPAHKSQPIASILPQFGRSRDDNAGLCDNSLDLHRSVRQQQMVGINYAARRYLGNERECERRFSSAEMGGTGQSVVESISSEEPRSVSSPPRIVACLDDKERLHMIGAGSATEWHRAPPPTPAMLSTGSLEIAEFQLKAVPSTNTGDAHFRKTRHPASNVDFNSERNPRISKTMPMEPRNFLVDSDLYPSHVASREDPLISQPDVHRLIGDTVSQSIHSLHSNANVNPSSIPLASISQNDLTSHTLQNSISSNLYPSEACPGAEKAAHLQTGFDPRAEGWLTNSGGSGRKPVGEPYKASPSRSRHSLPAQPGNSSVYAYGNKDNQQRGTDPRKRPSPLADAHRYAYGISPRGDSEDNNLRS